MKQQVKEAKKTAKKSPEEPMTRSQATFGTLVASYNHGKNKNVPIKQRYSPEFMDKIANNGVLDKILHYNLPSKAERDYRQTLEENQSLRQNQSLSHKEERNARAMEHAAQKMGITKNTAKHTQHVHKQKNVQRMAMN